MEGLRERKKRMTREAIFAAADRLFAQRGFDAVTVAEIADAANVSVKTLFTYVRSKEDLVFGDDGGLLDDLVAAVRDRDAGCTPLDAVTGALRSAMDDPADPYGLEGFHRTVGDSPAIRSRLRRMWSDYEDTLTEVLAAPDDDPAARAQNRLTASMLIALVRSVTTQEVRALVTGRPDQDAALRDWIATAAERLRSGLRD